MEVAVRLYAPLKRVIDTHSFLVGSHQGGETDVLGVVMAHRGETTLRDLRKPIEETKKGKMNYRSRLFADMIFEFNDTPNIHGMNEARRRKYLFALFPSDKDMKDDSKAQDVHPKVIPYEKETELFANEVLPRLLEKYTICVVQEFIVGPGCGQVCLGDRPCVPCDEFKRAALAASSAEDPSLDSGPSWESIGESLYKAAPASVLEGGSSLDEGYADVDSVLGGGAYAPSEIGAGAGAGSSFSDTPDQGTGKKL